MGAEPAVVHRAFRNEGVGALVALESGTAGLFTARSSSDWFGTRSARDAAFRDLSQLFAELVRIARGCGARLVPPAVSVGGASPVFGGDLHTIEVASAVEQEVLCNLLRMHVPDLIAVTGRGAIIPGRPPDRIGSRWLADSRAHLATRFLASTTPEHLDRVMAELRRRDGVAQIERMDVAPTTAASGAPAVVVRCLDAAVGLAGLRAQVLLLAALVMHARRRIRDGRRVGDVRQPTHEQNRARAIASGLRARFIPDAGPPGRPGAGLDQQSAEVSVRTLLENALPEFYNLEVAVEELAPVLLAVELARFGGRRGVDEGSLLRGWAANGDAPLLDGCERCLTDADPGGPFLRETRADAAGTVAAVLRAWAERIEATATGTPTHPPPSRGMRRAEGTPRRRQHRAARPPKVGGREAGR